MAELSWDHQRPDLCRISLQKRQRPVEYLVIAGVYLIAIAKPDKSSTSLEIYLSHHCNLPILLKYIVLVDANGICPQQPRVRCVTESLECGGKVLRYHMTCFRQN